MMKGTVGYSFEGINVQRSGLGSVLGLGVATANLSGLNHGTGLGKFRGSTDVRSIYKWIVLG